MSEKKLKRLLLAYVAVFIALGLVLHNQSLIKDKSARFIERKLGIFIPPASPIVYEKKIIDPESRESYDVVVLKISKKDSEEFLNILLSKQWGTINKEGHKLLKRKVFEEALALFPSKREKSLGIAIYDKYPNLKEIVYLGLYDPDSRTFLLIDRR